MKLLNIFVVLATIAVLTGSAFSESTPKKDLATKYKLQQNEMGSLCGTTENVVGFIEEAGGLPMFHFTALALPGKPDVEFWAVDGQAKAGLLVVNAPDKHSCIITPAVDIEWHESNMQHLLNRFLGLII